MQTISGIVERGAGYGKKLGFPTMNIPVAVKNLPPEGVYAGTAELDGKKYRAGIVVGPGEKIEVHLIGYDGDAYGKEVSIDIQKFLREFKKFDTEAELIIQIKKDMNLC
ncbi:MAG: riboflavin kinase [bacterium]|nr:riboflavin kinase [bacterium]